MKETALPPLVLLLTAALIIRTKSALVRGR